jgi:hypothetical protein
VNARSFHATSATAARANRVAPDETVAAPPCLRIVLELDAPVKAVLEYTTPGDRDQFITWFRNQKRARKALALLGLEEIT